MVPCILIPVSLVMILVMFILYWSHSRYAHFDVHGSTIVEEKFQGIPSCHSQDSPLVLSYRSFNACIWMFGVLPLAAAVAVSVLIRITQLSINPIIWRWQTQHHIPCYSILLWKATNLYCVTYFFNIQNKCE